MFSKPTKKWQMLKTKGNSIFFERVKKGTFAKSDQKKWHFRCPNKNSETTFISPTSPKNDGIVFDFRRSQVLDGFSPF